MISQPVDVVIVGGGPAGAAIAIALVRGLHASLSVTVLERSGYEHPRIGETLPPEARVPLASLGLWNRFLEQRHAPASGTLSVWGQDQIAENHFICNPHGNGWHLDRQRSLLPSRTPVAWLHILAPPALIRPESRHSMRAIFLARDASSPLISLGFPFPLWTYFKRRIFQRRDRAN